MTESTPLYRRLFGTHHLESLLCQRDLQDPAEKLLLEQLAQQCLRHAVWFGLAAHPDVDGDLFEPVWGEVMNQLAEAARNGQQDEVKEHTVRLLLTTLTASHGLHIPSPPEEEVATPADLAAARLGRAADKPRGGGVLTDRRLPLVEMFTYNRSLGRRYSARPGDFAELIEWTAAALSSAPMTARQPAGVVAPPRNGPATPAPANLASEPERAAEEPRGERAAEEPRGERAAEEPRGDRSPNEGRNDASSGKGVPMPQ